MTNLTRLEAVATGKPIALPKSFYFDADFFTGAEWVGERPPGVVFLGATHAGNASSRPVAEDEEPIAYIHYFYNRQERCFKPVYGRAPEEINPQRLSRSETALYVRVLIESGNYKTEETAAERHVRDLTEDYKTACYTIRCIMAEWSVDQERKVPKRKREVALRMQAAERERDEIYAALIAAQEKVIEEAEACKTTS